VECPNCKGTIVSQFWPCEERVCSSCGLVLIKTSIAKSANFIQWNPQWHSNWQESDSETLKEWLTTLRTVSSQLNLPSIPYKEEAARKIRKENRLLSQSQKFGKYKRATVAALLHLILKQYGKNRPIQEICKQLSLDSKLVIRQAWNLSKTAIENHKQVFEIPRKTPIDYLFEHGGKIATETTILIEAKETLQKIRRRGGNPIALAAGALYYVCKKKKLEVTKEKIAEAFGISHRTVYSNEAQIRAKIQEMTKHKTHWRITSSMLPANAQHQEDSFPQPVSRSI
jgi:transcription initiation factor TFIIIB Brf1 subunit/transcription initiation factor TFIIB